MYYGLTQNDFIKVFGENLIEDSGIGLIEGDEQAYTYIFLSEETLEAIKQIRNVFDIYIFQRTVFPNDETIKNIPTKKIEYDVCYQLICGLSDILVFNHQKNILGYRADLLLELKSASFDNIPGIVVEIDEDSHKNYDQGQEEARQTVLEHFVNRVIKIPVKRSSTSSQVEQIVQKYITQIRNLFADLIYEYTSEITEEQFVNSIDRFNTERGFLQLFFNEERTHEKVAEYLGYRPSRNFEDFRKVLLAKLTEGIHYTKSCYGVDPVAAFSEDSTVKNQDVLTRIGFNALCIESNKPKAKQCLYHFVNVYNLTLDYVTRLRAKLIKNKQTVESKLPAVNKRIEDVVYSKTKNTKTVKMENELKKLREENKELKDKIETIKNKDITIADLTAKNINLVSIEEKYNHIVERRKATLEKYNRLVRAYNKIRKENKENEEKNVEKEPELKAVYDRRVLLAMKLVELKQLCQDKNIKKYSNKNKDVLIQHMLDSNLLC